MLRKFKYHYKEMLYMMEETSVIDFYFKFVLKLV